MYFPKPNKITTDADTHYISYNHTDESVYGGDTTALVIHETNQFLILKGDHTAPYIRCKNLEECVSYFYKNIEEASDTSEHGRIFKMVNGKGEYIKGGY